MKKKVLTFAMIVFMALGLMSITAGAETDTSSVTITKTLTAIGLEDTTFSFTVSKEGMANVASGTVQPDISGFDITVSENATTNTYNITLPTYDSVGTYTYKITETKGNVLGVTYTSVDLYLVVTVTNDGYGNLIRTAAVHEGSVTGDKDTKAFTNNYNAGSLTVSKEVTGNLGDTSKEFEVTVTFEKSSNKTINSTISYTVGSVNYTIEPSAWTGDTYEVTFLVKDGSSVTFNNIPYDMEYTVTETNYSSDGYTTSYSGTNGENIQSGTLNSAAETLKITNYKNSDVDTGVILDNLPYILILAIVFLGVIFMVFRKRTSDRY